MSATAAKASPLYTPAYIDPSSREGIKRRRLLERLENGAAFLSRTDLRELGLERRAVDAVFLALPVTKLPGYSRPLIRVGDYLALLEASTARDGEVVR